MTRLILAIAALAAGAAPALAHGGASSVVTPAIIAHYAPFTAFLQTADSTY